MKRVLLLLCLLLAPVLGWSQVGLGSQTYTFTAAGSSTSINLVGQGYTYHTIAWGISGGTMTACTFTVDSSADGTSWSTGAIIPSTTCTSNGTLGFFPVLTPANFIRVTVATFTANTGTPTITLKWAGMPWPQDIDPCASPMTLKSTAVVNISTATTAAIVPAVAGDKVYVCTINLDYTSGTTPTVVFKYGTQVTTACDTGATSLSGTMAIPATVGQGLFLGPGHTLMTTALSNQFCITSGGTTPNLQGFVTYVQQ